MPLVSSGSVTDGLLVPAHFTELSQVSSLLTNLDDCSCQRVVAFICEGRIGNAATTNWWAGTFEADITHTNTGSPVQSTNFPWYSSVYSPLELLYDGTNRNVEFRFYTNENYHVSLSMNLRSNVFANTTGRVGNLRFRVAAKVAGTSAYLDSLTIFSGGTSNTVPTVSTSYDSGTETTVVVSNLALQAGFSLTGNARFDWSQNPLPQNSQISFQISADESAP